jgi:hypothetical protein
VNLKITRLIPKGRGIVISTITDYEENVNVRENVVEIKLEYSYFFFPSRVYLSINGGKTVSANISRIPRLKK